VLDLPDIHISSRMRKEGKRAPGALFPKHAPGALFLKHRDRSPQRVLELFPSIESRTVRKINSSRAFAPNVSPWRPSTCQPWEAPFRHSVDSKRSDSVKPIWQLHQHQRRKMAKRSGAAVSVLTPSLCLSLSVAPSQSCMYARMFVRIHDRRLPCDICTYVHAYMRT